MEEVSGGVGGEPGRSHDEACDGRGGKGFLSQNDEFRRDTSEFCHVVTYLSYAGSKQGLEFCPLLHVTKSYMNYVTKP